MLNVFCHSPCSESISVVPTVSHAGRSLQLRPKFNLSKHPCASPLMKPFHPAISIPSKTKPMEIKGSAVKSIPDFIKKNYPDKYQAWLDALPESSRQYFKESILASSWYPLYQAAVAPTELLGKLFYDDPEKGAWQCGRFSAETALTGIYKFFIKAASPFFIIDRAGKIFTTFYQPTAMEVVEKGDHFVVLHITRFDEPSRLIEMRIAGWIERAMEIHGVSFVTVDITKSLVSGDSVTEIRVTWGDQ